MIHMTGNRFHIIPKMYLKLFADIMGRKNKHVIYQIDKETRRKTPSDRIPIDDIQIGARWNPDVETSIVEEIETSALRCIKKLEDVEVGLNNTRLFSLDIRDVIHLMLRVISASEFERNVKNVAALKKTFLSPLLNEPTQQSLMTTYTTATATLCFKFKWNMWSSPVPVFFTSDAPFGYEGLEFIPCYISETHQKQENMVIIEKGAFVYGPLSPRFYVYGIVDEESIGNEKKLLPNKYGVVNDDLVKLLNGLTIKNAKKYLYWGYNNMKPIIQAMQMNSTNRDAFIEYISNHQGKM